MVNQSGRQCLQIKVHHSIGTNDHCRTLFHKSLDNARQRISTTIKIIRIQLNGITTAGVRTNCIIPTSSDAQICAIGLQ